MSKCRVRQGVIVGVVALVASIVASVAVVGTGSQRAEAGPEMIGNPSVETVDPSAPAQPLAWEPDAWGTITAALTHPTGDAHTGTRYARVAITARTSGDAKWRFEPVPVVASTVYTFSDWYRASASTELVVEVTTTTGAVSWIWLRSVPAATAWTQVSASFTTPANAAEVTVLHLLQSVGSLDTDDSSLSIGTAGPDTSVVPTFFQAEDGIRDKAT